jgi:putative DNA primase/helicase
MSADGFTWTDVDPEAPASASETSPAFSDDYLALKFTDQHADKLRYVHKWGTWLRWDGTRWVFEGTLAAFDMARVVAREYAAMCNTDDDDGPNPTKIASASTVSAIERLARSDRRHAVTVDIWDDDPWLLNTPSGIVDLKTGSLLSPPRDPAKYMTKITAVAPGGDCPRWLQFLAEVTGGNVDYQAFLQRLAGYTLTGSVKEHAWFFLYGTGGNGKGVFLNTLFWLLHDYAAIAPMETFVVTHGNSTRPTSPVFAALDSSWRRKPRRASGGRRRRSKL